MKEISYCFAIVNPAEIQDNLLKRLPIPAAAVSSKFISNQKITFTQEAEQTENGQSWKQRFKATCKDETLLRFNGLRKCIAIFLADGRVTIVGNTMSSPILMVTDRENIIEITADFNSLEQSKPISVL